MRNSLGLIKVGYSENPENRRKAVESYSGLPTTLEHTQPGYYLERPTHSRLEQYRKEGEWFDCSLELAIETLNDVKKDFDKRLSNNLEAMQKAGGDSSSANPSDLVGMPIMFLTRDQLISLKKFMLNKLLDEVGGIKSLASMLNENYMTISDWVKRGQTSKRGAQLIEDHPTLGEYFKAIDLRPDL